MNGFSTRAIRAATRPPKVDQQANSVPIYQSVTFSAGELDELGEILTDKRPGYAYARIANPTDEVLAAAIAELHGAEDGFVFATGMAAIHATLLSVLRSGDRIVCTRAVYGSTRSLLANVLGGIGIRTDFVDPTDLTSVETSLASEHTRVLYVETISNPTIVVADLEALAQLARRHGAIFIVDNTFASPYLCRPLDLGADLIVESATKFIGGHSDVLAGVAVGNRERIARLRAVQTDTGATLAPFAAFLVLRGLTTLALRMERHSATATALASWLERQPASSSPAAGRPAGPSSTPSRFPNARPRSAASTRSSPIPPRPLTASCPTPRSPRPGSRRASFAAPSAWRISTTCRPTSRRRSRRRDGWPRRTTRRRRPERSRRSQPRPFGPRRPSSPQRRSTWPVHPSRPG